MTGKIHWRCFHCDKTFTKAQEKHARLHFGSDLSDEPVCKMRVPGEHHLLQRLRRQEAELESYRREDTDLHRALHSMLAEHAQALRRAEEDGYNKGVRDMQEQQP